VFPVASPFRLRVSHHLDRATFLVPATSNATCGVPDVVKIAPQIDIYDACLVLNDCLGHSVDRLMSCLLGSVSKRSRLNVGFKDRLQAELERPLHHPISSARPHGGDT
jgi:hypothetical protein